MNIKELVTHITEKLDQSEKGYSIPKIIHDDEATDTQHQIILEYSEGMKYLITIEKIA